MNQIICDACRRIIKDGELYRRLEVYMRGSIAMRSMNAMPLKLDICKTCLPHYKSDDVKKTNSTLRNAIVSYVKADQPAPPEKDNDR